MSLSKNEKGHPRLASYVELRCPTGLGFGLEGVRRIVQPQIRVTRVKESSIKVPFDSGSFAITNNEMIKRSDLAASLLQCIH